MSKYSTYVQGYIMRHGLSGGELPVASAQPSFQEYYDYPWDNIPNIGMVSAQPITNSNPFDKFTFSGITSPAIFKYSINDGPWSYFYYAATGQETTRSKLVVELKENAKNVIRFLTFDRDKFRFPRPENALVVNITHDADFVRVIQDTFAPPETGVKVLYCKDDIYPYAMSVGQPAYSELTEDVIINACDTAG